MQKTPRLQEGGSVPIVYISLHGMATFNSIMVGFGFTKMEIFNIWVAVTVVLQITFFSFCYLNEI